MNRWLVSAASAALALALAACGGGGGGGGASSVLAPHPGNLSNASVPQQLLVKNWGGGAMNGATYVGSVSGASLDAEVLVHQQNAQGLVQYAQMVSDPSSAYFHKFLTPQQIAQQFGATQADYQAAATYFESDGLSVAGWNQRMVLHVAGPQADMEKAFGTTFGVYQRDGQDFIAPMSQPHFSQVVPVDQVGDIVRFRAKHTYLIPSPRVGAGFASGFSPQTVAAAFDYVGAFQAGYSGTGITIGIIGTGPIDAYSGGSGDHDLDALLAATNDSLSGHVYQVDVTNGGVSGGLSLNSPPPSSFPYSNGFATPPQVTAPCPGSLPNCNPEDGEAQLDTQQAATLAPGATVDFYLAYNASDCTGVTYPNACPTSGANAGAPMIGITESDPEIQQVINDDVADVVTMSFGLGESQAFTCYSCSGSTQTPYVGSYSQLEFAALAAEGIAVFASSGDDGSANCFSNTSNTYLPQQCVSYPAGDPNVTSVGGITTNVNGLGQPTAPWLAWGISTMDSGGYGGGQGSGGGTSTIIPISAVPWQQTAIPGASMREQPDVSLDGDPSTGVAMVENSRFSGGLSGIGGTSVAAPEMAAMWADLLSACTVHSSQGVCAEGTLGPNGEMRLGNASPYLYAIYAHTAIKGYTPSLMYTNVFYDIVYGDNQMANPNGTIGTPVPGFNAVPGYDEVSGIGVPFAGHLIESLTGLTGIL